MTTLSSEEPQDHRRFYHRTVLQHRRSACGGPEVAHHSQAILALSELVTFGVLQAMKNVSQRAFYHWFKDNYGYLFPQLPHRTRLNRRLRAQQDWTGYFLADATVLGVADSYGIELRHPVREGRRTGQIGRKGKSNHRWPDF